MTDAEMSEFFKHYNETFRNLSSGQMEAWSTALMHRPADRVWQAWSRWMTEHTTRPPSVSEFINNYIGLENERTNDTRPSDVVDVDAIIPNRGAWQTECGQESRRCCKGMLLGRMAWHDARAILYPLYERTGAMDKSFRSRPGQDLRREYDAWKREQIDVKHAMLFEASNGKEKTPPGLPGDGNDA